MSFEAQLGMSECLHSISKHLNGKNVTKKKWEEKCQEADCLSLRIAHILEFSCFSHECDSKEGKDLSYRLLMHVNQYLINDAMGRGLHYGRFKWRGDNMEAMGNFRGITNSGTHWSEPNKCEECDIKGHIEGQLAGIIYYKNNQRLDCHLFCSYALYFEPSQEFMMSGVEGTIEGVIACECKK
jgi:hypothetical protein